MSALETYLSAVRTTDTQGVKETSFYNALATLLNAVGLSLSPRVQCILHPRGQGAGIPDGGLFTQDQVQGIPSDKAMDGQLPARGVLEVKGFEADLDALAKSEQVRRYWGRYRLVLVTNLWSFALIGGDENGRQKVLETYKLAEDARTFRAALERPSTLAALHDEGLIDFLRRALRHDAPIVNPSDLAWFLASYARQALAKVEQSDLPALRGVREALEGALGLSFEGPQGNHFFRSTLVQTLFYGVFSAWVLWSREQPGEGEHFSWREAAFQLHVPVIRGLFEQVAAPGKLRPLGLMDILDRAGAALNRTDRTLFFARFEEDHAVQYFYEPFLKEFDPDLRRQLGVWYTPPEVVRYMVARVDTALREELGRPAGLADPDVYVLDPCCGTGAYLVEVLRLIDQRLREGGGDALSAGDVKRAAMERIFGFEILPAPFVVAHLQLGLLLRATGAPFVEKPDGEDERAAVYLTNALTGWEPASSPKTLLPFPELSEERDAAAAVKQSKPILVVLGNPPYNGYAGVAVGEEKDLATAYRKAAHTRQPQGQGLNDLYVRFFRMAERRIAEQSGEGVICYISNYSWLDGLSFTAMREHFLHAFDSIAIDSLNGDKYKTGKVTPEGRPDPSIFSTPTNREGIQVGTAVVTLVRKKEHQSAQEVSFRNLWGSGKHAALASDAERLEAVAYQTVTPASDLGLPFVPLRSGVDYLKWPLLPDLFPVSFPGVKTSRDDVVVDIDRERLTTRMERYFDPTVDDDEMRRLAPGAMESTARFQAVAVRARLQRRGFLPDKIVRYCYRPFDVRWLYWEPETKLLDEKREDYEAQVFEGNVWMSAGQRNRKEGFYQPQFVPMLADHHIVESNVGMFPLYLNTDALPPSLFDIDAPKGPRPNLSARAEAYLAGLGATAEDLFYHALAVLHAPLYREENAGALRQDWPRAPLPRHKEALTASAALGREVAALLDTEISVPGVSVGAGPVRLELRSIGTIARTADAPQDEAPDLAVTAGWGHGGNGRPVMPARGHVVERAYTREEQASFAALDPALDLTVEDVATLLGDRTYDLYLNDHAYWRNVPSRVWTYTMGGYGVLKKWLSYREHGVLGRALSADEAREITSIARRIAALLLLDARLDANYLTVRETAGAE